MTHRVAFTSITANYIPKARVLAQSVKRHSPDTSFVLVVVDDLPSGLIGPYDPFDRILSAADLGADEAWLFEHTVVEACTAIKGRTLTTLLEEDGERQVVYFDPDIVVLHSLEPLFQHFEEASTLLTPHGIEPETDIVAIRDNEISHLKHGVYNLGFVGVKNSVEGLRFARWWAERLDRFCFDEPGQGIFTDQRWVDLAPTFFDEIKVLRKPGYNVATWNLSHRVVTGSIEDGLFANGEPLVFYHFSGFDSGAQEVMLERYGGHSPVLFELRRWYIQECLRMGQDELGGLRWQYGHFDNGQTVTKQHRLVYRYRDDLRRRFPNPFVTEYDDGISYFHWFRDNGTATYEDIAARLQRPEGSEYQVIALALEDHPDNVESLQELLSSTSTAAPIRVIVTDESAGRLLPHGGDVEIENVSEELTDPFRSEELVVGLLEREPGDVAFVDLRCKVPPLWDLRLRWRSASASSIVTVSPVSDSGRFDLGGERTDGRDPSVIDRELLSMHRAEPVDAPEFSTFCFYFRRPTTDTELFAAAADGPRSLLEHAHLWSTMGLDHVVARDVYVAASPDVAPGAEIDDLGPFPWTGMAEIRALHDRFDKTSTLDRVDAHFARRNLHVGHSWGGGLERWLHSYVEGDTTHRNLVLRSLGSPGAPGEALALYADVDDDEPLAEWQLPQAIASTDIHNLTYRRILHSILSDYGIDQLIVSSLIGHSLDALDTGYPTIFVCHDYFPMHPNIYLRSRSLAGNRVARFSFEQEYEANRDDFFPRRSLKEARDCSRAFRDRIVRGDIRLVAPSPSTKQIYLDLETGLAHGDVLTIAHGTPAQLIDAEPTGFDLGAERLRLVFLGRMAPHKGAETVFELIPRLTAIADIYLVGSGQLDAPWHQLDNVFVYESYEHDELIDIIRDIDPHVGLVLSDFAETFCYVLDELMSLAIPPIVRDIGALSDWVVHGKNGFVVDADADKIVDLVTSLDRDRSTVAELRDNLTAQPSRSLAAMVAEYEQVFGLPHFSVRAGDAPERFGRQLESRETERAATPTALLPIDEGKVQQLLRTSGFSDDGWCSPTVRARLRSDEPVRSSAVTLWFPPDPHTDVASVAVHVDGKPVGKWEVRRAQDADIYLELDFEEPRVFTFELRLDPSESAGDSNDMRQLCAVLRGLSFSALPVDQFQLEHRLIALDVAAEGNGRGDPAMLPLPESSIVTQHSVAVGYWDDSWCAPEMWVRLTSHDGARSGRVSLWFPLEDAADVADLSVRVDRNEVGRWEIARGVPTSVDFDLDVPDDTHFVLELIMDASTNPNPLDQRELAAVLTGLSFSNMPCDGLGAGAAGEDGQAHA